ELLQHDIIREMSIAGLLDTLTFIGGTCLRACYGSNRLSEDLDFTGGKNFNRAILSDLAAILVEGLEANPDERDKCLSQIVFLKKRQENNL
ncbi:MAG: nucleotidyl transferase AbiEii/AbiGii toxin family protein, partial [Sulfuricurvum sp.]|nr:nucleotidyl transferase AbiEii/AbiGii toxin family protein [Sulfuricurvum sp.]